MTVQWKNRATSLERVLCMHTQRTNSRLKTANPLVPVGAVDRIISKIPSA